MDTTQGKETKLTIPNELREFMSIEELAARMGIGLTTAYALAKRNELPVPVIRIGRIYRFSRRAFDALATAQHDPAGTDAA